MPSLAAVNLREVFPFGALKLSVASCAAARPALPKIAITARTNRFILVFLKLRAPTPGSGYSVTVNNQRQVCPCYFSGMTRNRIRCLQGAEAGANRGLLT